MNYPTLEQYNEAFQHIQLSIVDPALKKGAIATTGLGLPLAMCGGFALTYTVTTGSAKYAVRCFHKQSNDLENRYIAISNHLKSLNSTYFLDFEFQPHGILVNNKKFPIVKMAWASGETLGEFLDRRYRNKSDLQQLNSSLRNLSNYLEEHRLAHGDIQPGNIMVANNGRTIQLIDYDGMFVDELKKFGSAELGHRNFQHPGRTSSSWDTRLDRFSFIALNIAIRALEVYPDLWIKSQSDGDATIFKANDFADPDRSYIFGELYKYPQFADDAKNFATICKATFDKIPSFEDFLARKNIPETVIKVSQAASPYISAFPVLDAKDYEKCLLYVGNRVELIGKIVEVKQNKDKNGKTYIFINFGPWQGKITKIIIWSDSLSLFTQSPDQNWVGTWISVIGLMEPPYKNPKFNYTHLAISIKQANQLHKITEKVAKFRLFGISEQPNDTTSRGSNKNILAEIRSGSIGNPPPSATASKPSIVTQNQAALNRIKAASRPSSIPATVPKPASLHVVKNPPQQQPKYTQKSSSLLATILRFFGFK